MTGDFTADQRRRLAAALAAGQDPVCPACGSALNRSAVQRPAEVSYVRHRVLLTCPECKRAGAVDLPRVTPGPDDRP